MNRSEIAVAVESEIQRKLVEFGFNRISANRIGLQIDDAFLGWVGLNRGLYEGQLRVNPFVGIHCIPLMKAYYKGRGDRYRLGDTATFACPLHRLVSDLGDFIVPTAADIDRMASEVASIINIHGVPYMRQIANYSALAELLRPLVASYGGNPEKYILALALQGETEEAEAETHKIAGQLKSESPVLRGSFEKFASAFLAGDLLK